MLDKIYLEITNACNLDCSFCHKTARAKKLMRQEEFDLLLGKLTGKAKYLYFHLMGEPTLHPLLPQFIKIARDNGFFPMVTTNGSLLREKREALLSSLPYKISISLHAPEANAAFADEGYLESCVSFAKEAARKGCIVALRLWNLGSGADNSGVLDELQKLSALLLHEREQNRRGDVGAGRPDALELGERRRDCNAEHVALGFQLD